MARGNHTDLPLFAWQPPCKLIAFPMVARVGKIRDVASKMLTKTTENHQEWYVKQVTEGLAIHLAKIGLHEAEINRQIDAFWQKVDTEMTRLTYGRSTRGGNDPRGAA